MVFRVVVALFLFAVSSSAFKSKIAFRSSRTQTNLNDVPLELSGKLDPSKKWDVTLEFNGISKIVSVSEGSSILDIAETVFDGENALAKLLHFTETEHYIMGLCSRSSTKYSLILGVESSCRNGVCTTCAGKVGKLSIVPILDKINLCFALNIVFHRLTLS